MNGLRNGIVAGAVLLGGFASWACGEDSVSPATGESADSEAPTNDGSASSDGAADAPSPPPGDGGFDADGPIDSAPPNQPPVPEDASLEVEIGGFVAGQLQAHDPEGDPITFMVAQSPTQGTLTSLEASTGLFVYTPNATAGASDSFTFHVDDGKLPSVGVGTVSVTIKPFDLFRRWVTTDVVVDGVNCSNSEVTVSRQGNVLTLSSRTYVCGSNSQTVSSTTYDIVGDKIYSKGVLVGSLTATSIVIEQSATVPSCGLVSSWFRILPVASPGTGYKVEDGYTTGSCGSMSATGTLHQGARVHFVSSGDFGRRRYPGPHDNTVYLANDGDLTATGIVPNALTAPFTYKGGTFPGTGGTCGTTLAAGAFCSVVLEVGNTTGKFTAAWGVSYSSGLSTQSAPLSLAIDHWRAAELAFAPATLDFGMRDRAIAPTPLSVTVTNNGTVDATSVTPTIPAPFVFEGGTYPGTGGTCSSTVAAGGTCTLVIDMPSSPRAKYQGDLTLAYGDGAGGATGHLPIRGVAANFVGYGLYRSYGSNKAIVPYYDLVGPGAKLGTLSSIATYTRELEYDPKTDSFWGTNRWTEIRSIQRSGADATIDRGAIMPDSIAIDPSRNRLVSVGYSSSGAYSYASRDLAMGTWGATATISANFLAPLKYRASDDKFVSVDTECLRDQVGCTYTLLQASNLSPGAPIPIDLSNVGRAYFQSDGTFMDVQIISADNAGKVFLVSQMDWWKSPADAAAGPFNAYKTAGYELDPTTNKISLAWEQPDDNVVQLPSSTALYGVGVESNSCSSPPCTVNVNVATGTDTVLVLSSYDAMNWNVSTSAGSTISKVIVRGYYANTVQGFAQPDIKSNQSPLTAETPSTMWRLMYHAENLTKLPTKGFKFGPYASSISVP